MTEFISIIIINHNGADHLRQCLASIKDLDYEKDKYEVIVFDNGSTDESIRVVERSFSSAVIIKNRTNIGFAAPHRRAAKAAKGDILAFLNNDMKVDSRWLTEAASLLDRKKGIVCASSRIKTWKGRRTEFGGGTLHYLGYADQISDTVAERGEEILFPCGGAMLILRDVFLEAGCFDDDYFAIFEDVDLGWRLWLMGYRVVMAPESFVYHRGHSTLDRQKAGKKRFLMHRNALMTIIKNYDDENLKKILPLAFILAVKRALLFMDIKKESFYFWKEDDLNVHMPPNLEEGCIHLAALDDVMENFVSIKRRREAVQAKRKRADREIFRLFKDPFRNLMGYKEYLWEEVSLFGHFSFEELFACEKEYENRLNEGIYHAEKTLGNLRKKIRKERWNIPVNVNNPNRIGQISDKFFRSFVQQGLGATLGKVSNHLVALMRKM